MYNNQWVRSIIHTVLSEKKIESMIQSMTNYDQASTENF